MITTITNADLYTVFATTNPKEARTNGISAFYVEKRLSRGNHREGSKKISSGMIGSDITEIMFENVRLTKDNLLGRKGKEVGYCHVNP